MAALTGVGLVPATLGAWAAWTEHHRITTWQAVRAVVLVSTPRPVLRYRYETDAGDLESERIHPGPIASAAGEGDELAARFPVGRVTTAWHDPYEPSRAFLVPAHGFLPYLILLAAAPIFALAGSMAVGALRAEDVAPLRKAGRGWWAVPVVRPSLVLRNGAAAALAVFACFGAFAFGPYLALESASPLAVLALLAWLALMAWFAWVVVARTLTAARLEEARVLVSPEAPRPGSPFRVRVEQRALRIEVPIRGVAVTLVGDRSITRLRGGRIRTRTVRVFRETREALPAGRLSPAEPSAGECTFTVPADAFGAEGSLRFRFDVRTRVLGPDYRARFVLSRR